MATKTRASGRVRANGKDKAKAKLESRRLDYARCSSEFRASAKAPGTQKKLD